MTMKLSLFWLSLCWACRRRVEELKFCIARTLPRWLVYHATVLCIAHATTGKHATTDASEIRAMTALKRWETSNE